MNKILLGSRNGLWKDILRLQTSWDILPYSEDEARSLASVPNPSHLVVLDNEIFPTLSEESTLHTNASNVVLLVNEPVDRETVETLKKSSLALFFVRKSPNGPSEETQNNFVILLESLFNQLAIVRRLNSYIRDSFADIVDSNILMKQKLEIEELNKKLYEQSRLDFLTNLLNRRAILDAFNLERNRALRTRWRVSQSFGTNGNAPENNKSSYKGKSKGPLTEHIGNFSCIMIDIDHFKRVNDTHGHLAGDQVLAQFSYLLSKKGIFRENDVMGRYGGEEFVVLLPDTCAENARIPAERLREAIKSLTFKNEAGEDFTVTISLGISEFLPDDLTTDEMIRRADRALYYSKEHGRDQTCVFDAQLLSER